MDKPRYTAEPVFPPKAMYEDEMTSENMPPPWYRVYDCGRLIYVTDGVKRMYVRKEESDGQV